ncbi:uncharacterized protein LOC136036932 isoform X2 [Artemia franciscana]|uniref:Uncharacterized protein n=1 Tax=Artemia franciscana TaxID=6661 RepID=A0AA88I4K5_ARTSF|nr:hypothetical protein QYM36_005252 [Artemia franciscana]
MRSSSAFLIVVALVAAAASSDYRESSYDSGRRYDYAPKPVTYGLGASRPASYGYAAARPAVYGYEEAYPVKRFDQKIKYKFDYYDNDNDLQTDTDLYYNDYHKMANKANYGHQNQLGYGTAPSGDNIVTSYW